MSLIILYFSLYGLACFAIYFWYKTRIYRMHLYCVMKRLRGPATLHMQFKKCPIGVGAYEKIHSEFCDSLIELQNKGYEQVSFISHLVRRGGKKKILQFLAQNNMHCEELTFRPTKFLHKLTSQFLMYFYHKTKIKVYHESAYMTIKLSVTNGAKVIHPNG